MDSTAAAANHSSLASWLAMMQTNEQLRSQGDLAILAARRRADGIDEIRPVDAQREQEERMAIMAKLEMQRRIAQMEMVVKAQQEREMMLARDQQQLFHLHGVVAASTLDRNTSALLAERPRQQVSSPDSSLGSRPTTADAPVLPRRPRVPSNMPSTHAGAGGPTPDGEAPESQTHLMQQRPLSQNGPSDHQVPNPGSAAQQRRSSPSGSFMVSGSPVGPVPTDGPPQAMLLSGNEQKKVRLSPTASVHSPGMLPHSPPAPPKDILPISKSSKKGHVIGSSHPTQNVTIFPAPLEAQPEHQATDFERKTTPHPSSPALMLPSTLASSYDVRYLELAQRALRESNILPPPSLPLSQAPPTGRPKSLPLPAIKQAPVKEDCSVAVVSECSSASPKPNTGGGSTSSCMNSVSSVSSAISLEKECMHGTMMELKRPAIVHVPAERENKKAKRDETTEELPETDSLAKAQRVSSNKDGGKPSDKGSLPMPDKGNKILQLLEIATMF